MRSLDPEVLRSRILVVDDTPANVVMLADMLDIAGYGNVLAVTDSREVIGICKRVPFDLILLDMRMPHLSGLEVMGQLSEAFSDEYLPVLVLTAQTDDETRKAALAAGAKDFINKPFTTWEVLQRIQNTLETRLFYKAQKQRADELDAKVREKTHEIRELQLEIIRRLGRAAEYRDNETGAHVVRMSRSCQILALAAGLGETQAEDILYASPMHDVGKIGIPDSILLKPGRLDPEERKVIETHAELGFRMLQDHDAPLMRLAADIALTHHEHWDGNGYPSGLVGTAIPIEGRIAAICDVFDALTSSRPYKLAWSLEEVCRFFADQSGKQFDPVLTEAFLRVVDRVYALRNELPDGLDRVQVFT